MLLCIRVQSVVVLTDGTRGVCVLSRARGACRSVVCAGRWLLVEIAGTGQEKREAWDSFAARRSDVRRRHRFGDVELT